MSGIYIVITAAGSGTRLGCELPKALVPVAGKTMLTRSIESICGSDVNGLVVTAPADHLQVFEDEVAAIHLPFAWRVVPGGDSRQASVAAGLQGLRDLFAEEIASTGGSTFSAPRSTPGTTGLTPGTIGSTTGNTGSTPGAAGSDSTSADYGSNAGTYVSQTGVETHISAPDSEASVVLIHDAARCLTPLAVAQRVIEAVKAGAAAVVPALPVVDTIRLVAHPVGVDGGSGPSSSFSFEDPKAQEVARRIGLLAAGETLDRTNLRAVQTPQGFPGNLIFKAHFAANASELGEGALDDSMLVAALGFDQYFVDGDSSALKITHPLDLQIADWIVQSDQAKGAES